MEVWIEPKKITEGLYGNNGPRHSAISRNGFLKKLFQRFPSTTTKIGEQLSVIEEIPPQDFGYAENEMALGYGLEDLFPVRPTAELSGTSTDEAAA